MNEMKKLIKIMEGQGDDFWSAKDEEGGSNAVDLIEDVFQCAERKQTPFPYPLPTDDESDYYN